jgi:ActR/RegA family two-component response regulator
LEEGKIADRCAQRDVLLVEDEDSHAMLIRRFFEDDSSEWMVHHATGVAEALSWLEQNRSEVPVLVIADYCLADGTGLDLARDAKSPEEVGFPLIILTGVGSEKLAVFTLKSGAMEYLVKDAEDLKYLPKTARRVMLEWSLIIERRRTEDSLKKYIDNLEKANCNLEDFAEEISREMAESLSSIQELNCILWERYANDLDDEAQESLCRAKAASEKMSILIDGLARFLVPVYLDSTFIRLYNAKLDYLKHNQNLELIQREQL